MRRAAKRDSNHGEIVRNLRRCGVWVFDTASLGNGFPDLLTWTQRRGFVLLEVKDGNQPPSKRKLTKDEKDFFFACPGPAFVVHSLEDALTALGIADGRAA